jgi:hypothetical protein
VFAEQLRQLPLARLLLLGEDSELLLRGFELLDASQLTVLFFVQRLLALLLFAEFIALLLELLQTLGDLSVELQEGGRRFIAQGLQRVDREQIGERRQLFIQTLAITGQLTLLGGQVLGRLLARRFGAAQLLVQARGILLQGEQGGLALFVLADALVQLAVLLGQPGIAFGDIPGT